MILFQKLRYANILSTGNTFTEIDLARNNATLIVGKNGVGKCLDGSTEILIKMPDGQVKIVPLFFVVQGFKHLPDLFNRIYVSTRYGWKLILGAECTARNSRVFRLKTSSGKLLEASPQHLMWVNGDWKQFQDILPGDILLNDRGADDFVEEVFELTSQRRDLYDLCVEDVHEFYANGLVSHNSTFIDALTFALYGRPFRAINKPQLVNSITGKGLLVEVDFTIGKQTYMVRRGVKPNIFEIFHNGEKLNQLAGARDDQEYLEQNILRLNFKSFSQIVVLGNANYTPFMQLPAAQRRAVVEDLLDIQVFSLMNTILKERATLNKQEAKDTDRSIDVVKSKLDLHNKHVAQLQANNQEMIEQRSNRIAEHETSVTNHQQAISDLMARIEQLSAEVDGFDTLVERKQKYTQIESALEDRLRKLKKEVQFFHDNENCPTCKQGIDHTFQQSMINTRSNKVDEITTALVKLENDLTVIKEQLDKAQKINQQIVDLNSKIQQNNQQIKFLNSYIADLNEEINTLRSGTTNMVANNGDAEEFKRELKTLHGLKQNLAEERTMYEVAAHLLKDSGIKTKIIKQFIPIMNKLINKYLAQMDFMCDFHLDESFNETIRSRYRDIFSINSFSEGEKMRLNIAIMLAWRAIAKIRNSAATNLLIMDEVLDSSLDGDAHDAVMTMIEESGDNQNIFIISHSDRVAERFEHVITFEKHGNFSRIA